MTTGRAPHPVVAAVRRFVDQEVRPVALDLEHRDEYPHALVARMRELGIFGALVPETYGGLGLGVTDYARVIEELCRGWMSLAGVINSHTMAALIVRNHGTEEQRQRFLGRFARGEARGGLCLTEAHAGSDVQALRTAARRRGDEYVIDGAKMFITNGREGNTYALLAVTDPGATPRHRGMSCFIVEKGHPGFRVVKSIAKLGYKGVDTAELLFEDVVVPAANLVGGVEGRGFSQVMSGLEAGRINIAARAVGVAQAAYEASLARCRTSGQAPPALADLATRVTASRLVTYWAAGMKDRGERCDLEAGMAKLFATEAAQAAALDAMRIHGTDGLRQSLDVERHWRDTPLMIIGEGTNEIQRLVITRNLLERYGERLGALTSRDDEGDERRHLVLAVRQFVDKEIVPVAAGEERAGRYPAAIVTKLADLGILGALVPPESGGLGLDAKTFAMIVEELARGWTTVAALVSSHLAAAHAIARAGTAEQRERLLPGMSRGEIMGTVAPGAAVTARLDRGAYVLDGVAKAVENASRVNGFLIPARLVDGRTAAFLVGRDVPGLAIGAPLGTLGARGLDPCDLALPSVRVDASWLLGVPEKMGGLEGPPNPADARSRPGNPGTALEDAVSLTGSDTGERGAVGSALAILRLGAAATAVGLAQAAFEAALRYAQQRTAFGKPICQHQAIQLKLADMATAITAARLLAYDAAERDGVDPDGSACTMAKLAASEAAYVVTLESMRIHGGYGYTAEFPVERYYRDAARLLVTPVGNDAERAALAQALAAHPGHEPTAA